MRILLAAMLLLAAPAFADDYASKLGNIDCRTGKNYAAGEECKPHSCKADAECVQEPGSPIGGLPYICLKDISYCGWKGEPRAPIEGK